MEITDVPGYRIDLAVAQQGDIFVASHGHHFGGENSGRTIQRGEGLVELGHVPADTGLLLYQVDVFA